MLDAFDSVPVMKSSRHRQRRDVARGSVAWPDCWARRSTLILAVALVLGVLFASLMAASPNCHQSIHGDSRDPAHSCLATLLEHQQLVGPDARWLLAIVFIAGFAWLLVFPAFVFADFSYRISSSRAPPAVFLLPPVVRSSLSVISNFEPGVAASCGCAATYFNKDEEKCFELDGPGLGLRCERNAARGARG